MITNQTYSCICPIHGNTLITKRKKTIRISSSGERYTKPYFLCSECNAHYIFVDELDSNYEVKIKTDGGTIKVLGNRVKVHEGLVIQAKKKKSTSKKKKAKTIVRYWAEDVVHPIVAPTGKNKYTSCPECGGKLMNLVYKVPSTSEKGKSITGKECEGCGRTYFSENICKVHSQWFEKSEGEKEETEKQIKKETKKETRKEIKKETRKEIKKASEELSNKEVSQIDEADTDQIVEDYIITDDFGKEFNVGHLVGYLVLD